MKRSILTSHHKILNFLCNHYEVISEDVLSKSREKDIVKVRNVYIYLLWDIKQMTHENIAFLVNRNHSTITYSLQKTRYEMEIYKQLKYDISILKKRILDDSPVVNHVDLVQMSINHTNSFI